MFVAAVLVLTYLTRCSGKIYEDVSQLPGLSYDFIVVGGGTAGNVVANRLTENPNFSVLVLEAGLSNEGVVDSIVPFLLEDFLQQPTYEWNYTSVPQAGLNGRNVANLKAFILGGCSAHNGMVYTRGAMDDYDRFAAVTGDPGWSWNNLLPFFFKNEKWTPPVDHHDTRGQFNPSVHSSEGINSVSLSALTWPEFSHHVIQSTKELPNDWPFNVDMNSGKPLGLGWIQSTIGGGKRSSSAASYLGPEFITRGNLHVLLHAQVSKLVNSNRVNGKITFGGVEFAQGGALFTAKATKEIILSAGSVGTPNILLHSGIGSQKTLSHLGISTLLDLPSVGQNATDHPVFGLGWTVNSNQTQESITQNTTRFNEAFAEWNRSHTGPFTSETTTQLAWLRLDNQMFTSNNFTDPSPGPDAPHIEFAFSPGTLGSTPPGSHTISVGIAVLHPLSRGSVTINSSNPFASPIIDAGFLLEDLDIFTGREGIRKVLKLFNQAPTWQGYLVAPTMDLEDHSDDALDAYIRSTMFPAYHLVSTAAMSAKNAGYGVVDPDLLVKGASGLRIIDASVMPFVISGHTQAATYVIAERGADLVKKAWGPK
ncbi:GMC oxidoreductase [Favolaschia claudopus]|uniref:GMC oxidoreductase n=1 Tax=Favolaschia claudopus TaxID=2862362 RepID=A0AAW0DL94_9AGAR